MRTHALRAAAITIALAVVLLFILARLSSWIRYGVDYPYKDDWRALMEGRLGSFDPAYLFTASNDTLYPVGKALDSAAQHLLGSNAIVYQSISMVVVLGLLLAVQFLLLRRALGDAVLAAALSVLTVLALRSGDSYWGLANLGYHQALPLVLLLAILLLASGRRGGPASAFGGALVLALLAGFTYVSGAFATLAASLAILAVGWFLPGERRRRVLAAGAGALAGGAVTSVVQAYANLADTGSSSLAMPWDPDLWRFMLGVLADSLMLPAARPTLSFVIACSLAASAVVVGVLLAARVARRQARPREVTLTIGYLGLALALLAYLGLVAMGRLEFMRDRLGEVDPFLLGWERFYQWWPTVLWPWLIAAVLVLAGPLLTRVGVPRRGVVAAVGIAAAAFVAVALVSDEFDYDARHQELARERDAAAACVSAQLASDAPLRCELRRTWDLADAVLYAHDIGMSFARSMQVATSAGEGTRLAGLGDTGPGGFEPRGQATVAAAAQGVDVAGDARHAWRISPADEAALRSCRVLEVSAAVRAPGATQAQARYVPFSPGRSGDRPIRVRTLDGSTEVQDVSLVLISASGFKAPVTLFPAIGAADYSLLDAELVCHRSAAAG